MADKVTPYFAIQLHEMGFTVRAFGVTDEQLLRRVIGSDADGMIVNFQRRRLNILEWKELRSW